MSSLRKTGAVVLAGLETESFSEPKLVPVTSRFHSRECNLRRRPSETERNVPELAPGRNMSTATTNTAVLSRLRQIRKIVTSCDEFRA